MLTALIALVGAASAQHGPPLEFTPSLGIRGQALVGYSEGLSRPTWSSWPTGPWRRTATRCPTKRRRCGPAWRRTPAPSRA